MLARIEKLRGVLSVWTDRAGTRIVVSFRGQLPVDQTVAAVTSALAPSYRSVEVTGPKAADAVRACQMGAPGWYRAAEVGALSREEARVLALRWARAAAVAARLDAERLRVFERLVREGLTRAFKAPDLRALNERCRREVEGAVDALGLPPDQAARLREALEAAWRRSATPRRSKRWF